MIRTKKSSIVALQTLFVIELFHEKESKNCRLVKRERERERERERDAENEFIKLISIGKFSIEFEQRAWMKIERQ